MRTRDRSIILIHDFTEGHEYQVKVCAVDSTGRIQKEEDSLTASIVIQGKTDTPASSATLTATGAINSITVSWTNPPDYDFAYMEIWRSSTNSIASAVKIAEAGGTTHIDAVGTADATRYYWIRAVNTSGKKSTYYPGTETGVGATSLGITVTDIGDFAITASKIFNKIPVLDGDSWTDNNPAAGKIAWNAHSIYYNGAKYDISAGSTDKKYVYWETDATPPIIYRTSDTAPSMTDITFIIATNVGGIHSLAWNSMANQVIGSAYILDAAVVEAKIGNLAVGTAKIALLAVDTAQIAALAVGTAKIGDLAVTNAKIFDLAVSKLTAGSISSKVITLAITAGTGDCYIGAGKTDFTNTQSGFILGLDDSDSDRAKFYIGDATTYLNWTGTGLVVKGSITITAGSGIANLTDAGGLATKSSVNLATGEVTNKNADNIAETGVKKWAGETGADITSGHTAAFIASQGALAIRDDVGTGQIDTSVISGGKIVTGLLTATNIQVGTLTGRTVQTAASGQRLVMNAADNTLRMYRAAEGSPCVTLDDDGALGGPSLVLEAITSPFAGSIQIGKSSSQFVYFRHDYGKIESAVEAVNAIFWTKALSGTTTNLFGGVNSSNVLVFAVNRDGKIVGEELRLHNTGDSYIHSRNSDASSYYGLNFNASNFEFEIEGTTKVTIAATGNIHTSGDISVDNGKLIRLTGAAGTTVLKYESNEVVIKRGGAVKLQIGVSTTTLTNALVVTGELTAAANKIKLTALGGYAVKLTNKTGSSTVAGQLVKADTATNDGFILTGVDEAECIGIVLDGGVANNAEAWIVVTGIADVAMEDNTAATRGNWVFASTESGYADATLAAPPGGGVVQLDQHMQEIGHCIESVSAGGGGTHILARCIISFN